MLTRADGAARLYDSATPSDSAVGFHPHHGFVPTDDPDHELLAEEPDDIHVVLPIQDRCRLLGGTRLGAKRKSIEPDPAAEMEIDPLVAVEAGCLDVESVSDDRPGRGQRTFSNSPVPSFR